MIKRMSMFTIFLLSLLLLLSCRDFFTDYANSKESHFNVDMEYTISNQRGVPLYCTFTDCTGTYQDWTTDYVLVADTNGVTVPTGESVTRELSLSWDENNIYGNSFTRDRVFLCKVTDSSGFDTSFWIRPESDWACTSETEAAKYSRQFYIVQ